MTDFKPKARRPRGFVDRRGRTLAREREIVEKVLGVYEAWGFERLETSAFEYADALGKFLPDQDRPNEGVFALTDDDEQWMALRYDLTAPLARFVAENYDALPKPYRRCAAGPVWRNEKPGPGRFREFWQCDADTVGAASPAADAEMIAMACAALEAATGSRNYVVKFSNRKLLDGLLEKVGIPNTDAGQRTRIAVMRALDKYDRLGASGVTALLTGGRKDESGDFTLGAGLGDEQANEIVNFQAWSATSNSSHDTLKQISSVGLGQAGIEAIESLRQILGVCDDLGVSQNVRLDTSVIRGLEYYTGTVFEAQLRVETPAAAMDMLRFGSVGGGGRYDDLVSRFKGTPIPATGFSVGVSRLAAALTAQEDALASDGPVVVLPFDAAGMGDCMQIAAELREAFAKKNIKRGAEVYLGGSGPKAQLKYADKRGAPAAVIVGGDELANNTVSIKNLRLGAELAAKAEDREAWTKARDEVQVTVARSECAARVLAILAGN
ncbi:MAG: histidine--tRNA ligase [Hyphomonadaceae bacterium]|nr:histidine--tRNA ligase [Hyphomonadaceae bacterium]